MNYKSVLVIFYTFQIEYNHEDFAQVLSEWVDTSKKSQPSLSGPGNQKGRKRSAPIAEITESVPFEGPGEALIVRRGSLGVEESDVVTTEVQPAAFK